MTEKGELTDIATRWKKYLGKLYEGNKQHLKWKPKRRRGVQRSGPECNTPKRI